MGQDSLACNARGGAELDWLSRGGVSELNLLLGSGIGVLGRLDSFSHHEVPLLLELLQLTLVPELVLLVHLLKWSLLLRSEFPPFGSGPLQGLLVWASPRDLYLGDIIVAEEEET